MQSLRTPSLPPSLPKIVGSGMMLLLGSLGVTSVILTIGEQHFTQQTVEAIFLIIAGFIGLGMLFNWRFAQWLWPYTLILLSILLGIQFMAALGETRTIPPGAFGITEPITIPRLELGQRLFAQCMLITILLCAVSAFVPSSFLRVRNALSWCVGVSTFLLFLSTLIAV